MKLRILFPAGILLFSIGLYAQTPDGETPANEGICDELVTSTPGLYGLCVAFCEAQDCEPDLTLENPFDVCKASNPKILEIYDRKKRDGDPDMPCVITETSCPCFSEQDLQSFAWPDDWFVLDYGLCEQSVDHNPPAGPYTNSALITGRWGQTGFQWVVSNRQYLYGNPDEWRYQCGRDFYTEPPWQGIQQISESQETLCRELLDNFITSNGGCPPGTGYPY